MRSGWLFIASLFVLAGCKNDLEDLSFVEVDADAPDRTTFKAEYFFSDSGRVRNRLRAGRVDEYLAEEQQRTELAEGVELVFFDATGRESSLLTARKGRIDPKTNRMEVEEDVVFTNAKGERMETTLLIWSQDSDRVWTNEPVTITRERDIIYGQGLDAVQDFSRYTIRKITGTLFVQPDDTLDKTTR